MSRRHAALGALPIPALSTLQALRMPQADIPSELAWELRSAMALAASFPNMASAIGPAMRSL
jgi:hypothetical protein